MSSKSKLVLVQAPVAVPYNAEQKNVVSIKDLDALKKMSVDIIYHAGTDMPKEICGNYTTNNL